MNRKRAKELLPIIQAWSEGATIEVESESNKGRWLVCFEPQFEHGGNFRIKPEPREFWLTEHQDGSISFRQIHIPAPSGSIKVREVLDDERIN